MSEKDIERLLSVEEVANYLGVSKDTVRAWVKKETLPYYKIGRFYKFKLTEIEEWIQSGKSADADK